MTFQYFRWLEARSSWWRKAWMKQRQTEWNHKSIQRVLSGHKRQKHSITRDEGNWWLMIWLCRLAMVNRRASHFSSVLVPLLWQCCLLRGSHSRAGSHRQARRRDSTRVATSNWSQPLFWMGIVSYGFNIPWYWNIFNTGFAPGAAVALASFFWVVVTDGLWWL